MKRVRKLDLVLAGLDKLVADLTGITVKGQEAVVNLVLNVLVNLTTVNTAD